MDVKNVPESKYSFNVMPPKSSSRNTFAVRPKQSIHRTNANRIYSKPADKARLTLGSSDYLSDIVTPSSGQYYEPFVPNFQNHSATLPMPLRESIWSNSEWNMAQLSSTSQELHISRNFTPFSTDLHSTCPDSKMRSAKPLSPYAKPYFGILHEKMDPYNRPECAFCKRNNAKEYFHHLKDEAGGVVCPVLSSFTCKMCAATGRDAHTHKYCPVNPVTKGDPVAAGMPPGRPLNKVDRDWLKFIYAKHMLDVYLNSFKKAA